MVVLVRRHKIAETLMCSYASLYNVHAAGKIVVIYLHAFPKCKFLKELEFISNPFKRHCYDKIFTR